MNIRINRCLILFMMLFGIITLAGCGLVDTIMGYMPSEDLAYKVANGEAELSDFQQENFLWMEIENINTIVSADGEILYFDEKTGQYYPGYYYQSSLFCDFMKRILQKVIFWSLLIGFALIILFKKSARVRKFAIKIFVVGIPVLYIVVLYGICYAVDHLM